MRLSPLDCARRGLVRSTHRLPIDGLSPRPKPQSCLGIELRVLVAKRAPKPCRDIQFQMLPNAAPDSLTKLCLRLASRAPASPGCAKAHWDRQSFGVVRQVAPATPC